VRLPKPSPARTWPKGLNYRRATSSLGIQTYFESKSLARFCCEFLNLQRLAESAFSKSNHPNEAQTRQVPKPTDMEPGQRSVSGPQITVQINTGETR
jgi:hypothetical protein